MSEQIPGVIRKPVFDRVTSAARKLQPVFDGFLQYFSLAIPAVAEFSRINNEKHNPGERVHWSKGNSSDHANCVARHLIDIGENWDEVDPETGRYHAEALVWRSCAVLQMVLEAKRAGMNVHDYMKKLAEDAKK